jgi:pyruvate formate lyase activating enzyme
MTGTAELLGGSENLIRVELLPYHKTAGAKYQMLGRTYDPEFDTNAKPQAHAEVFEEFGLPCAIL